MQVLTQYLKTELVDNEQIQKIEISSFQETKHLTEYQTYTMLTLTLAENIVEAAATPEAEADLEAADLEDALQKETASVEIDTVKELNSPVVDNIAELSIDGQFIWCTPDHPFYVQDKGWSSYSPETTAKHYGIAVQQLKESDILLRLDLKKQVNPVTLKTAKLKVMPHTQTYNLSHVEKNNNFFANGILVHNKRNTQQR